MRFTNDLNDLGGIAFTFTGIASAISRLLINTVVGANEPSRLVLDSTNWVRQWTSGRSPPFLPHILPACRDLDAQLWKSLCNPLATVSLAAILFESRGGSFD
uniref:Uncharacterized protein n=1 Tax=Glossina palpalis gambiensis TaxID=67801 RepID=A0A1B0BAN1_9MUSC